MSVRLFFICASVFLTACTQQAVIISEPPDSQRWQQHAERASEISQWNLQGRASIHNSHDGGQVDIFWQQYSPNNFEIRLVAPFGSGTTQLSGNSQGVLLMLPNGETTYANNLDELFRQNPEWSFPVSELNYWIRGIPSPNNSVTLREWNALGLVQQFEQNGWSIELRDYREVQSHWLPGKIFAKRVTGERLDVRLVIREWGLP